MARVSSSRSPRRVTVRGLTGDVEEARIALLRQYQLELRAGVLSPADFDRKAKLLARPSPPEVRPLWDAYLAAAPPELHGKLRAIWSTLLTRWWDGRLATEVTATRLTAWERELVVAGYSASYVYDGWVYLAAAVRTADLEALPWFDARGRPWRPSRKKGEGAKERPALGRVELLEQMAGKAHVIDLRRREHGAYSDLEARTVTMCLCALRNGEGSGLGWDDCEIDHAPYRARIRHQAIDQWRRHYPGPRPIKPPKGGKPWTILLHDTVVRVLRELRDEQRGRGWWRAQGPVFPCPKGKYRGTWRNNANCIRPEETRLLARLAGVPEADDWVTHSLRHSAATLEHVHGQDLRSTGNRTRHADLKALEDYIHQRTGVALAPSAIPDLTLGAEGDDAMVSHCGELHCARTRMHRRCACDCTTCLVTNTDELLPPGDERAPDTERSPAPPAGTFEGDEVQP